MSSNNTVVIVPYATRIEPECERGLRSLEQHGTRVWRYQSDASIDRVRCDAATAALDSGVDEVIWIDPDIVFDKRDVQQLRDHKMSLVAGVCPVTEEHQYSVYLEGDSQEGDFSRNVGLRNVRYVGAGFLYTTRAVYDDIRRTYSLPICDTRFGVRTTPYFLPMVIADSGPYWYLSADFSFCERARVAGHNIAVDTDIHLERVARFS